MNPFREKGRPIDKQLRDWSTLAVTPYNKDRVHPYTRTRIILMNGIEVEAAMFGHQFARHTDDMDLRRKLAMTRRVEQQQQRMVNWFPPGNESNLEVTIGYEQVAVDLTAFLARTVPDRRVKAALDFALLEDFDHLYRYANLLEMTEGKRADKIVGEYTEIMPGRPTALEHRHPFDEVREPSDSRQADVLTKLHIHTIVAAEQQTMNYYMNIGSRTADALGRALYQEIGMIEEQHVSHYESLLDPRMTWFERAVMHEYHECYMYHSCAESEVDPQMKKFWESCLEDEITHLQMACDVMREHGRAEPDAMGLGEFPTLTRFEPNKEYIREILRTQVDLTADRAEYVPVSRAPETYLNAQRMINDHQKFVPSERVIEDHVDQFDSDYRLETEGPHPVERFRMREAAVR